MLDAALVAELMDAEATEAIEPELDAAIVGIILVASVVTAGLILVSMKCSVRDEVFRCLLFRLDGVDNRLDLLLITVAA